MDTTPWVGHIEGKPLVYDPAIQLADCPHLFLWDPEDNAMAKYMADSTIKPCSDSGATSCYIAAYKAWKLTNGADWLEQERHYYDSRRAGEQAQEGERRAKERLASLSLGERHRLRLEKLGKPYLGVQPATRARQHRVTHCYACKRSLDNTIDVECVACGWILCSCGACGCGYSGL